MGFRTEWIAHQGNISVHSEVMIHAIDRFHQRKPLRVLLVGVGNGGSMQVWEKVLPEGSTLHGVDMNPQCAELSMNVFIGDVTDRAWVCETFKGKWFDLVIDSTGDMSPHLWPYLTVNGLMVYENYDFEEMIDLARSIEYESKSWLPVEEIMQIMWFQKVAAIEKRNPRVVPYLNIIVGEHDPVIPLSTYLVRGAKRVAPILPEAVTPK